MGEEVKFQNGTDYFSGRSFIDDIANTDLSSYDPSKAASSEGMSLDDVARAEQIGKLMKEGGGLYSGVETGSGFNDDFYAKTYNAQKDYLLPQVDKQFADAQKQLSYALARQGLSASSQAGRLNADLQGQRSLALQDVEDKANTARNTQKGNVENERAELTRLLQQTGDAESTLNMAASRANLLSQAPALEAVGPLFQNATGTLADLIVSPALRNQQNNNSGQSGSGLGRSSGKVVS
jgi:hypothetical protein